MGRSIMNKPPKYCQPRPDRHGGPGYWYFERPGYPRVRLPGLPWSPKFMAAYEEALDSNRLPIGAKNVQPGTLEDLIVRYYSSAVFEALEPPTRRDHRRQLEPFREQCGSYLVRRFESKHIRKLTNEIKAPIARKRFLSVLRAVLDFGVSDSLLESNPADGIKCPAIKIKGFHSWEDEEIEQFEAHYKPGTRERLSQALLLYTGQRRSDVVRMGPQHIRDGVISIVQKKTGTEVYIPVHPELRAILDVSKTGHLAFLTTVQNKPFSEMGFSNWFRKVCDAAGLPHCSAHGLRKAAARRLADAGATTHEIAAFTGHKTLREVENYTRAANMKKLAVSAQAKVIAAYPRWSKE